MCDGTTYVNWELAVKNQEIVDNLFPSRTGFVTNQTLNLDYMVKNYVALIILRLNQICRNSIQFISYIILGISGSIKL